MKTEEFEYDVAFSFCQEDEYLVYEINEFLSENLGKFIYSQKQKELVGTDGEIEFKKVFSELSRTVVVLYRENYGKTKWTRIEEDAIRSRAYEKGYDFTLFIPVEKNKNLPVYLPKTRIWYDLEKYGVENAANIISFFITERGGDSKPLTNIEKAEKLKRKLEYKNKLRLYIESKEAYDDALNEVKYLLRLGDEKGKQVFNSMKHIIEPTSNISLIIGFENYNLFFKWNHRTYNSLNESYLEVSKWVFEISDEPFDNGKYKRINEKKYFFEKNLNWDNIWKPEGSNDYIKTEALLDNHISDFLKFIDNQNFKKDNERRHIW